MSGYLKLKQSHFCLQPFQFAATYVIRAARLMTGPSKCNLYPKNVPILLSVFTYFLFRACIKQDFQKMGRITKPGEHAPISKIEYIPKQRAPNY